MSFNENLKRIQDLPLAKRKIIFWAVIIALGIILFALWVINIKQKIKFFSKENVFNEMKLPELKQRMETLPKFESP